MRGAVDAVRWPSSTGFSLARRYGGVTASAIASSSLIQRYMKKINDMSETVIIDNNNNNIIRLIVKMKR